MANPIGINNGIFADVFIKIVSKQHIILQSQQPAFGQHCAVLLGQGVEIGNQSRLGEHHRLPHKTAAFCAADVEAIAKPCQIGQLHIVLRATQRISQSCPVHIEIQAVFPANTGNFLHFCQRIQCAGLGRLGDVDHTGHHHHILIAVILEILHQLFHIGSLQLAVILGNAQHLMAAVLDRAGLMEGNVAGGRGDDPLVGRKQVFDDHGVGLGTAHQKVNFCVRAVASGANLLLGGGAVFICAVTGVFLQIGFQ